MTLILGQLSHAFVLQVTDRLVTDQRSTVLPDFLANKNVIYFARDAVVSIGYTGVAYIGDLPTDYWIAGKLSGADITQRFNFMSRETSQMFDIGQALSFLARELEKSEVATGDLGFELVMVGWQWKPSRRARAERPPVPIVKELTKFQGGEFRQAERPPRHWYWKNGLYLTAHPGLLFETMDKMMTRLRTEVPRKCAGQPIEKTISLAEEILVDAVRSVSSNNKQVGPNCMSVALFPPHRSPLARVTFYPQDVHLACVTGSDFKSPPLSAAYTPWIIGPNIIHQPSVHVGPGSWDIPVGEFTVQLNGPHSPQMGLHAMSSQQRPPRPSRKR